MEFSTLHLFLILCHIDLGVIVVVVISKNNNYFFVAQMKNCQLISQRADSKYESGGLIFFIRDLPRKSTANKIPQLFINIA